ncbi:LCP family protein [Aminicella lysinilytica]|uniref:LytR family transcriptional attenuator n=1 Tax=Aminicella lysinilytica TaxID=433323 RepID=A0A4R6QEX9_9FIRM|nr:LCP family protein [Aminicella lysinilytica]TDP60493.1 LytR family transcriptional attenuator [Aminicella lysinilytica]
MSKTKNKTKHPVFAVITRIWSLLFLAASGGIAYLMYYADILPAKYQYGGYAAIGVCFLILFPALFFKRFKMSRKVICLVLSIALVGCYAYGGNYLYKTVKFFSKITKINTADSSLAKRVSVTDDSYNIYISGIDITGNIDTVSRSDVNMIVTVNPKTHKILLTSIPRDYLIKLPSANYASDKLTHTGAYGIDDTLGAVEDLLGIDMNYYVKVNYSTVLKLVDSIGGIDVNSDYTFTTSGMKSIYTFNKGMNHLNGKQALAFARERHSFPDGDIQRNKNQQKVMQAVLKKVSSSKTLIMKYSDILGGIQDYMKTNFTGTEIRDLIKMQVRDMPNWKITKQNMVGTDSTEFCYSTGADQEVSVVVPDATSMEKAVTKIKQVESGK